MGKRILLQTFGKQEQFINTALAGTHDFIMYGGSIRGGKTIAIIALFILLCRMYPKSKHVICRRSLTRLRDTSLPTFYSIVPEGFVEAFPSVGNGWECTFTNGSSIKFYAENIEKDPELKRFRGLEYDCIAFDELDVDERTFYVGFERCGTHRMAEREQGVYKCPYMVLATSNPQKNWVKQVIWDPYVKGTLPKRWLFIRSSVWDNPHVTQEWIERQRSNMPPLRFAMMMEGNWEVNLNDLPFFYNFSRQEHARAGLAIENRQVLWLSFDFNYDPTVCIVAQKVDEPLGQGGGIKVIAEHVVSGGTEALCMQLKTYESHPAGLYVTGDFSGSTRHTAAKNTDYEIISMLLNIPPQWFINIRTANKDFTYSRNLVNYALQHAGVQIDEGCKGLLWDLETAQVDEKTGKLIKDRDGNKQDLGDAFRYLLDAMFTGGVPAVNNYKEILMLGMDGEAAA
jgi:hypothetical protein